MATQNGTQPRPASQVELSPVAALAAFLLRVEQQEQSGLPYRTAVLVAAAEFGVDPAVVLRQHRGAVS